MIDLAEISSTRERIRACARDACVDIGAPEEEYFRAAAILIAIAWKESVECSALVAYTGLPFEQVKDAVGLMRACGMIRGEETSFGDWFDSQKGDIAFTLDVMTVAGEIERCGDGLFARAELSTE